MKLENNVLNIHLGAVVCLEAASSFRPRRSIAALCNTVVDKEKNEENNVEALKRESLETDLLCKEPIWPLACLV